MILKNKNIVLLLLTSLMFAGVLARQNSISETTSGLSTFRQQQTVQEKFDTFFQDSVKYTKNSAFQWLETVSDNIKTAESNNQLDDVYKLKTIQAQIFYDLGEFEKSATTAEKLYNESEKLDANNKKRVLNILDNVYGELQLYDKQLDVRTKLKTLGENVVLYDIYSSLGLHRQAMMDYIILNRAKIKEDDYLANAIYNNDIGTYLRKDGSIYTAIKNINTALNYVDLYLNNEIKDRASDDFRKAVFLKGTIQGNLGKCYIALSRFDDAIPLLEAGLSSGKEYDRGKFSRNTTEMWIDLADCYLHLNQLKTAKRYLDSIAPNTKVTYSIDYNRLLAEYHIKRHSYDSATYYYKEHIKLKDSLYNKTRKKQLLALLVEFDLENQKQTIQQQQLDIENAKTQLLQRDKKMSYSILALVLTLLGLGSVIFAYYKSIKNKRLIENQKQIIEASLAEKDSLLKEIHHRVKNNLQMVSSLLNMQTKNTRSKPAIEALEEGKSRVKAMALIHQNLYQNEDLSVIGMQGYVESLVNSIQSVYKKGGHNVHISIDAENAELDIDRAIPLGLILNELVSNSFKYAFPNKEDGMIYINISMSGETGYFEYLDTGRGFPDDVKERSSKSMGINLVNRLVNQLRSTLNVESSSEGVRFWFNFS